MDWYFAFYIDASLATHLSDIFVGIKQINDA
jgi:hypothetical protein